jgi:hypothetical protein
MTVDGFPNMFMVAGPQTPFANIPVVSEYCVEGISDLLRFARDHGSDVIETSSAAVDKFSRLTEAVIDATVLRKGGKRTWFLGSNIPGNPEAAVMWLGGVGAYCDECRRGGTRIRRFHILVFRWASPKQPRLRPDTCSVMTAPPCSRELAGNPGSYFVWLAWLLFGVVVVLSVGVLLLTRNRAIATTTAVSALINRWPGSAVDRHDETVGEANSAASSLVSTTAASADAV